jgi:hypothetical protein
MQTIKKIILFILLVLFLLSSSCSPVITKPEPHTPSDIEISEI